MLYGESSKRCKEVVYVTIIMVSEAKTAKRETIYGNEYHTKYNCITKCSSGVEEYKYKSHCTACYANVPVWMCVRVRVPAPATEPAPAPVPVPMHVYAHVHVSAPVPVRARVQMGGCVPVSANG